MTAWIDILGEAELAQDGVVGVAVDGLDIAVCSAGGALYAVDNVCTHGAALLSDGYLEGFELECPMHQGRFDVRTGAPLCGPVDQPLRTFPIRIEAGRVQLDPNPRDPDFA